MEPAQTEKCAAKVITSLTENAVDHLFASHKIVSERAGGPESSKVVTKGKLDVSGYDNLVSAVNVAKNIMRSWR